MKTLVAALFAGLAVLTLVASTEAQQTAPTTAPAVAPAAAPVPPLTDESLAEMIRNMGYEFQTEKTPKGNIYTVTIKRGTWTYIIDLSLSPSKTKLWLSGWLSELPKDNKDIPVEKLLDLLEGSWTNGPTHFRYHRAFRQLNLGLCLDNREVTPAVLRAQLEAFMDTMYKTEQLWNVKKWKPGEPVVVGKQEGKK